jgi:cell surface protein SprA
MPEYDPYDKDVKLKDKLKIFKNVSDSIKNDAVDFVGLKTINFTNVRFTQRPNKKIRLWSISNFDFSYSFTETSQRNPLVENNQVGKTQGGIGYNYSSEAKYIEPFKKIIKSPTPWLDFIRNINFNPMPSLIGIRMDTRRQFGAFRAKNIGGGPYKIPETYDKYFVIDRNYNMRWDLTRSLNVDFKAINNSRVDEPFGRIDDKEKKDSLMKNFLKGGRNTIYNQSADITYNFPTSNFPFLNWTTFNIAYRSTYNWVGASRLAINLGNTIQNSGQTGATAELNFTQLYSKLKLFRAIDEINQSDPSTQSALKGLPKKQAKKKKGTAEQIEAKLTKEEEKLARKEQRRLAKEERQQRVIVLNNAEKALLRIITSLKRVGISYNEGGNTFLPGYIDSTSFFGQNWRSMAPGLDFVMGKQPNQDWLNKVGKDGLITKDPILNNLFLQNYDQKLNITAQVEPVRDLIIDLNLDKSLTKNYSTLFKDTVGNGQFNALNPYSGGGFSISYISFQTLFGKFDPNNTSQAFKNFENYRMTLSKRLGEKNPYSQAEGSDKFYKGYGRYAQDVLVPAFIAAYTNKDPNTIGLLKNATDGSVKSNPFGSYLPKPNWRLTYNGLSRIESLQKYITNFTISHGYNSTLSMNSFNSALLFQDTLMYGFPSFIDSISGNFVPYFLIPNLLISEQFSPLIGVDFSTTGQLSGRFEYRKSRQLSMSLVDFQLSEVRSTEITFGMRWRKRGFPLPFRIKFGKKEPSSKLDNDITFSLDFSIRDDINSNSRLDQANAFATGGQRVVSIRPTIDYVISNRVNIQSYFDQRRLNPYVSNAAPSVNTRAGVQVRISLAQ